MTKIKRPDEALIQGSLVESLIDLDPEVVDVVLEDSGISPEDSAVIKGAIVIAKARRSPLDFCQVVSGSLPTVPYLEMVNDILMDLCKNERFVIVSLPVRMGKSELISKHFPAWCLGTYPEKKIILSSYNKETSTTFSRQVRDIMAEYSQSIFGVELKESSQAAHRFDITGHKGGLLASGVGSSIIGHGADVSISDDFYKDPEQAFSDSYNKKLREWWTGGLRTRLEPGGSMIIVLARWKTDDIAGYLIDQAEKEFGYDPWEIIEMPMLANSEDDVLGREIGEPLCETRFSLEQCMRLKTTSPSFIWAGQYQQTPVDAEGALFNPANWHHYRGQPKEIKARVRRWDLSAGGRDSDFLAGVRMSIDEDKNVYVEDVVAKKCESKLEVEQQLLLTSKMDRDEYGEMPIIMEIAPGAGNYVFEHIKREILFGFNVIGKQTKGKKEDNAIPFSLWCQNGKVFICDTALPDKEQAVPSWYEDYVGTMFAFPNGKHDDIVDASCQGFKDLTEIMTRGSGSSRLKFYSPHNKSVNDTQVRGNASIRRAGWTKW